MNDMRKLLDCFANVDPSVLKFHEIDESYLITEDHDVRQATNKVLEAIDEGLLDANDVVSACLSYMSESDVAQMTEMNDWFQWEDEDDSEWDDESMDYDHNPDEDEDMLGSTLDKGTVEEDEDEMDDPWGIGDPFSAGYDHPEDDPDSTDYEQNDFPHGYDDDLPYDAAMQDPESER